jgi:photosystem II stability/assembly factor-like uncharacterized protein
VGWASIGRGLLAGLLVSAVGLASCGSAAFGSSGKASPVFLGQVAMTSPSLGWALTEQGPEDQVLRTTDGGREWQVQETTAMPGVAVTAPDASRAFVLANDCASRTGCSASILYRTTDAGAAWHVVWRSNAVIGSDVTFVNPMDGFMVAGVLGINGHILLQSTDGGHTWTSLPMPLGCSEGAVALSFKTPFYGWLLCGGGASMGEESKTLYETTTAGEQWHQLSSSGPGPLPPSQAKKSELPLAGYVGLVTVVSPSTGYIALGRLGVLRVAANGMRFLGVFRSEVPFGSDNVFSLGFLNSGFGWLVGGNYPYLYTTTDGGVRWNVIHPVYASGEA